MPLKLHVSVNKKIGLPEYSSLGAACGFELELDQSLLAADPDGLQARIRQAYVACSRAVNEELQRQTEGSCHTNHTAITQGSPELAANGRHGHTASEKQLSYVRQLAQQINGLGIRKLDALAQKMFGKPVAGLTTLDASGLIDVLKGIKSGKIDVDAALNGAAV
ncbi:MAG: hypothetical protein K8T91_04400 [Planctomycetes bacterium]|nr:hypothetical protein [Planctomycetota bacterium]